MYCRFRIIFGLLVMYLSIDLSAKQVNIDSFENLIKSTNNDSIKSATYFKLAEAFLNSDLEKTFSAGQKALEYAVNFNDYNLEVQALNILGNVYQRRSNNDSALILYNQALALSIEHND